MTPSSITLGGRGGRHTQRVLKADPSGVALAPSNKERTKIHQLSNVRRQMDRRKEGGREVGDTAYSRLFLPLAPSNFLPGPPRKENPFIFHFICGVAAGAKLQLCAILRNERTNEPMIKGGLERRKRGP